MRLTEQVVISNQQIVVLTILLGGPSERRGLDNLPGTEQHVDEAKPAADDARVAKQAPHVVRPRAGGYVEILRRAAEKQIPHAAADEVGLEIVADEPANDLFGVCIDPAVVQLEYVDAGGYSLLGGYGRRLLGRRALGGPADRGLGAAPATRLCRRRLPLGQSSAVRPLVHGPWP